MGRISSDSLIDFLSKNGIVLISKLESPSGDVEFLCSSGKYKFLLNLDWDGGLSGTFVDKYRKEFLYDYIPDLDELLLTIKKHYR